MQRRRCLVGAYTVMVVAFLVFGWRASVGRAQSFDHVGDLPGTYGGVLTWGDADADGLMDLAVAGDVSGGKLLAVYRNNGDTTFSAMPLSLPQLTYPSLDWGDFDNDGDLDLLAGGYTDDDRALRIVCSVFRNDGPDTFTEIPLPVETLPVSCRWADTNSDGWLDITLCTEVGDPTVRKVVILQNHRDGTFIDLGLPLYGMYGELRWADFDRDGDLDAVVGGYAQTVLLRNDGNQGFVDTGVALAPKVDRAICWIDVNSDGWLDLMICSSAVNGASTTVYRNDIGTGGTFTDIGAAGLSSFGLGTSVAVGDMDSDGLSDLVFSGTVLPRTRVTRIYRNLGNDTFGLWSSQFTGLFDGDVQVADLDNDGYLDVAITGYDSGYTRRTRIYRNSAGARAPNTAPQPPDGLAATINGVRLDLGWNPGSDAETADASLTYNIRVGTGPGKDDVVAGMSDSTTGTRLLPASGNASMGLSRMLNDLPAGTYHWAVQAVDAGYAGSAWSESASFQLTGHTVAGTVEDRWGNPAEGITVASDNNAGTGLTGADGHFELLVPNNWSGTLMPRRNVRAFIPASRNLNSVQGPMTDQDFVIFSIYELADNPFPSVALGDVEFGDVDNDGDLDVVITGYQGNQVPVSSIYRNDGHSPEDPVPVFTDIAAGLTPLYTSDAAWGDYDNDGYIDLAIAGNTAPGQAATFIYHNNGDGTFTDIQAGLVPLSYAALCWGDVDNDGDLDLAICGFEETDRAEITKIYRNNGDGTFTDLRVLIDGVSNGDIELTDYDTDGDLDVAITGYISADYETTAIYRNDGNLVFRRLDADFEPLGGSRMAWGDVDNDGDADFVLTGAANFETHTHLYLNEGNDAFTSVFPGIMQDTVLEVVHSGDAEWLDHDNDGDLDLFLTGHRSNVGHISSLYQNDGDPATMPKLPLALPHVYRSAAAWGDIDRDGDLDAIIAGEVYNNVYATNLIGRLGVAPNQPPQPPTGLTAVVAHNRITFSWNAAIDPERVNSALTYNIRIGTADGAQNIVAPMADAATGTRRLPAPGNTRESTSWRLDIAPAGSIHWNVQAVDPGFLASGWASGDPVVVVKITGVVRNSLGAPIPGLSLAATNDGGTALTAADGSYEFIVPYDWSGTISPQVAPHSAQPADIVYTNVRENQTGADYAAELPFEDVGAALTGLDNAALAWGDYDNDGDLDLIAAGERNQIPEIALYRNDQTARGDWTRSFTPVTTGLQPLAVPRLAWGDIDRDGDLDLAICGRDGAFSVTRIYRNDEGVFTDLQVPVTGLDGGDLRWGDMDTDGDLDLVIGGRERDDEYSIPHLVILRNDGGQFTEVEPVGVTPPVDPGIALADYDNDGDLDMAVVGEPTGLIFGLRVYRNEGGFQFTSLDIGSGWFRQGHIAWADIDSDGDMDLALTGMDNNRIPLTIIYRNDGGDQFTDIGTALPAVRDADMDWADVDADGDVDLILCGDTGDGFAARIYLNDGTGALTDIKTILVPVRLGTVAWGDADNDGRLDLALAGDGGSTPQLRIYKNQMQAGNTAPFPPTELRVDGLRLSWAQARDSESAPETLTYNLRIGTEPGTDNVFAGMADPATGAPLVPGQGNRRRATFCLPGGLPPGILYWSVQTVDTGRLASPWSPELSFTLLGISGVVSTPDRAPLAGVLLQADTGGASAVTDAQGAYSMGVPTGWSGTVTPSRTNTTFSPRERLYAALTENISGQDYLGRPWFVETDVPIPQMLYGTCAWGDYDGDGHLDLALAGYSFSRSSYVTQLLHNLGGGQFEDSGLQMSAVRSAALAWADPDNDGDLDLFVAGQLQSGSRDTRYFANLGGGAFQGIKLPLPDFNGDAKWADYDNDGDLDLAITGYGDTTGALSRVYRNDQEQGIPDAGAGLMQLSSSMCNWEDIDNDGDLDLAITGYNSSSRTYVTRAYRNDGNDTFTNVGGTLPGINDTPLAWADIDADGQAELCIGTHVFQKNPDDTFTEKQTGLPKVTLDAGVAWGDLDNDGDVDVVFSGYVSAAVASGIYLNRGDGTFVDGRADLPAVRDTRAVLGDMDGDGDLDLILTGQINYTWFGMLYRNDVFTANTRPEAPTDLATAIVDGTAYFAWKRAGDAETDSLGLTYNLKVGSAPKSQDVLAGMADPVTGTRFLPADGNTRRRRLWALKGLDLARADYSWSVQSIDAALVGSQWAQSMTITADTTMPAATLQTEDIRTAGDPAHVVGVLYSDDVAVAADTVDEFDIRVTGPNGYDEGAAVISITPLRDDAPLQVQYSIPAPAGAWSEADEGTYTVTLTAAEVADISGNPVPAGILGTFAVDINHGPSIDEGDGPLPVVCDEDLAPTPFELVLHATDADADTLTWRISAPPAHGWATATGTGTEKSIAYTPVQNWHGTDSFAVEVADPKGAVDELQLDVTVRPRNDPPINILPPALSEPQTLGDPLTAGLGTWTDAADINPGTITLSAQWQRALDAQGTGTTDIAGATDPTFIPAPADFGRFIRCVVTAEDNGEGLPEHARTVLATAFIPLAATAVIELQPGWNPVSLPLEPLAPAVEDVFAAPDSTRNVVYSGRVWAWRNGRDCYYPVQEMHALTGCWLWASEAHEVTVRGIPYAESTVRLGLGWNLIGPVERMDTVPVPPALSPPWTYDGIQYIPAGTMVPGKAYWLRLPVAADVPVKPAPVP